MAKIHLNWPANKTGEGPICNEGSTPVVVYATPVRYPHAQAQSPSIPTTVLGK